MNIKRDDLVVVRLVCVGVLLAAIALVALLGIRNNLFTSISENITLGSITNAEGNYPLYTAQYYSALGVAFGVLFPLLVYASVLAVIGIFLKVKGSPALALISGILGIVMGVFLVLSKLFEKNAIVNGLFSKIYLGSWGKYTKAVDGVSAIPARAVICGLLLIVLSVSLLIMLKQSMLSKAKMYSSSDRLIWVGFLMPVIYSALYVDIVRDRLMDFAFSHIQLSGQIYGILDEYYLKNIFFISGEKMYGVVGFAIVVTLLYKVGIKKKLVQLALPAVAGVLSLIGMIIFLINPPGLLGYVTLDEAVCDKVESVGIVAMLVMLTDMMFVMALLVLCLDTSIKVSNIRILITTGISVIISIVAVLLGAVLPIVVVYILLLIINVASLVALFKLAYVRGGNH
jgi:hypothetical protein